MITFFSKLISIVFSPPGWIIIYLISAFLKGLFGSHPLYPLSITGIIILIPVLIIYILYQKKIVTHIDIVNREERIMPLIISNFALWSLLYMIHQYRLSVLTHQLSIFAIILLAMTIITLTYKISMHMTFTIFFSYAIHNIIGGYSYLLYLLIPLIFWSRLHLKRHTVGQLILAILVCMTIISLYNIRLFN